MYRAIEYSVDEQYDGMKIFTFLKYKNGFSTKLIRTIKNTENGILLNGNFAKTIELLHTGDNLRVLIPSDDAGIEPIDCELDIVYEDEDILVINKSPYMAMHPTHNHQGDTLANGVASYLAKKGKPCTFRAVGRLDKGTSGIVICALNPLAACKLSGKVKKEYTAVVKGVLTGEGTVDVPIYRPDPMKTLRACSYELGTENAVTHWRAAGNHGDCTVIKLNLETGRTHQIRVHMAYIGHPLAGDGYYGDFRTEFGHQLLHCGKAEIIHPVTGEKMTFSSDPPDEFRICIESA
ncbi:MAG: RluA family pseudouridine synthase [Clostridia bacterium]|nr:RluA family pseudouridine synthase [Clostridia bacterium]